MGTSGDEAAYEPYLQELGAAKASDKIYAASVYCPITNLKHADAAYEWMFGAQSEYEKMDFSGFDAAGFNERDENSSGAEKNSKKDANQSTAKPARKMLSGKLSAAQIKISDELKAQFPAYLNSLSLKDGGGRALSLDKNGDGSFKDYINGLISASFADFAAKNPRAKAPLYLAAKIKDDASQSHMLFWGYATSEPRAKTPPALIAATPVGATIMFRLLLRSLSVRRKVVLPVPAFPVRKILIPVCSTKSHALRNSWFFSILFVPFCLRLAKLV